jgi:hypothetical protein
MGKLNHLARGIDFNRMGVASTRRFLGLALSKRLGSMRQKGNQ